MSGSLITARRLSVEFGNVTSSWAARKRSLRASLHSPTVSAAFLTLDLISWGERTSPPLDLFGVLSLGYCSPPHCGSSPMSLVSLYRLLNLQMSRIFPTAKSVGGLLIWDRCSSPPQLLCGSLPCFFVLCSFVCDWVNAAVNLLFATDALLQVVSGTLGLFATQNLPRDILELLPLPGGR